MSEGNNRLQGTWVIDDFYKRSKSKIKSDYMKFGEEQLKFILNNTEEGLVKVAITIKVENFKSKTLQFKAKFELIGKDESENKIVSNSFDINQSSGPATIEFPVYWLYFEDQYVVNDKVKIKYDLSSPNITTVNDIFKEEQTNSKVVKDYKWEISDYESVAENVASENYQYQDLAFKLLISRPKEYYISDDKFSIEIECVKIKNKYEKYTFEIELMNELPSKSETKSTTYQFEKEGDSVSLKFDLKYKYLTESNGFLFQGGASLKLKCANYDFTQQSDIEDYDFTKYIDYQNLQEFVNYSENNSLSFDSNSNYRNNNSYSYGYTNTTSLDSSKETTGYVGLRNQGATCYMNSMLQSLFHIPAFRRIVYRMHTTGFEDVSKSIPLCLQRLFVYMQCSDKACSTKALTKSFGWDDYQTIVQHDVQEFSRVLLDNLEEKMKNTELDGEIAKLFRGKYRSFIRCINVDYESSKIEDFYDLQLVVKDTVDLSSSFAKYVETEKLDDKYNTDQYGKQDAIMGTEFIEFPSILHLHLRRFEYDFNYDQMTKINSRFEFPQTIDLSPYLAKDADHTKSNVFDLYGVLVHSGSALGGHYYAFLRTSTGPQWYQFNDSHVTTATPQQSIDENFGGSSSSSSTPNAYTYGGYSGYSYNYSYNYSYEKSYSAYMLVYVRKSDANKIFTPVSDDEIPEHLKKYFKDHPDDDETTSSYGSSSNDLAIKVVPEEGIIVNTILGKNGYECKELTKSFTFTRETDKDNTVYEKVAAGFGLKPEQIRLWVTYYQFAPYSILSCKDDTLTYTTSFFLQKKEENEELEFSSKLIILMKFFDLTLPLPLQYIGSTLIEKSDLISTLFPKVIQILGLPENLTDKLLVFQENSDYAKSVEPTHTFQNEYSKVQCLIFQFEQNFGDKEENERASLLKSSSFHFYTKDDLPQLLPKETEESKEGETTDDKEKEKKEAEKEENEIEKYKDLPLFTYLKVCGSQKVKDVNQYFQSLKDPVTALAFDYNDIDKPLAIVQFSPSILLEQLKEFVVKAFNINYNPETDLLLIYRKSYYENEPYWEPIHSETISNEFYSYYNKTAHRIYYRLIPNMTKDKMETMATVDVSVSEDGYNVSLKRKLLIEKESSVENLKDKIFEMLNIDPSDFNTTKYRLSKINDHKYEKQYDDMTQAIQSYDTNFRLDFIPEEQRELIATMKPKEQEQSEDMVNKEDNIGDISKELQNDRILVLGSHLTTEYSRAKNYGDPFYFILIKNESYDDFFNRVKETLKIDDSMKRCKLLISNDNPTISKTTQFMKSDKNVGEYLDSLNLTTEPRFYLFHPPHQVSYSNKNEAVKINN